MTEERAKRKLTAILSADVVGYSRLMGEDELTTVRTLEAYRELVAKIIRNYSGRVVDSPGDNVLAEFASVVDAVESAVEIQKRLKLKNAELTENRRMEFRIGINLGDVIEEGERIYGDGVNVAARIEGLAQGGGICISRKAFQEVKNKLSLGYEYLGEHSVKNIAEPVRVYRVLTEPEVAGNVMGEDRPRQWHWAIIAVAIIVAAGGLAIWNFYLRPPSIEPASIEKMALPLPDKPSIAVLPFENLNRDPKQDYFVDGMTDDLITDLSKISGLFVIARNSVFRYKGKPVDVKKVSRELGVRHVLEGSVRKAGNQVRINAKLIDASTGGHLWAERYDGKMDDVFALQDKITRKIVTALAVKLAVDEEATVSHKGTKNILAYDEFLKGMKNYYLYTPESFAKAISYFKKALRLDPNYAQAHAALALTYWNATELGLRGRWSMRISWYQARLMAGHYLKLAMKNPNAIAHQIASQILLIRRQYDEAITEARRAISLDPNDPNGHLIMAFGLIMADRAEDAMYSAKKASQLDPLNPARPLGLMGLASFCLGETEEAIESIERALRNNPGLYREKAVLTACYTILHKLEKARAAAESFTDVAYYSFAKTDLQRIMFLFPFKNLQVSDRFADGLIKAGLYVPSGGYYRISKENRLTGEESGDLLFGRKVAGKTSDLRWSVTWSRNGKAKLEDTYSGRSETGRSWVDGDMICHDFPVFYVWWVEGEHCGSIYRNPDGKSELKNEYLMLTDFEIRSFSPVE